LNEVRLIRTLKLYAISETAHSINFYMALRDFAVNLVTRRTIYLLGQFIVKSVTKALSKIVSGCNSLEFYNDVQFDSRLQS
jgi:hypothetical protein